LRTKHKTRRAIFALLPALLAISLLPAEFAAADNQEKQLKIDYLGKVLTLRHFYSGDHLKFHSDGMLEGSGPVGPWTLDGQIEVEDIQLRGAHLVLKARRIHRIFDAQGKMLDELDTLKNPSSSQQKDLKKSLEHVKVEIQIELPSENPAEKDIAAAIHAVFLAGNESRIDIVPTYWQSYFAKLEGKTLPPSEPKEEVVYALRPKAGVSPPHATYSPEPQFSEEARKAKYQGTTLLSLIVDSSGSPDKVQIERPIGLGLDEMAVQAVKNWTFTPATRNGDPVAVAIHVEVSFHLY
jgi:TonB family protein